MSIVSIRSSLEVAVNAMPALSTAWENVPFEPVAGVPYQQVFILFAEPDNIEYGSNYRELGFMQINLLYPLEVGTKDINTRAELIRTTFKRGNSFTSGGVTTTIHKTPEIMNGRVEGDRYKLIVKIPFFANLL